MTVGAQPALGELVHEVSVELNETGTEAAAATALRGLGADDDMRAFRVDQPFVFALRHRATGAVLFLGRVVDPAPEIAARATARSPYEHGPRATNTEATPAVRQRPQL